MVKKMSLMQWVKTVLFYIILSSSVLVWGSLCLIVFLFIPYRWLIKGFIRPWCRFTIVLLDKLVGIRYRITGFEHLPKQACVIVSKHQSTWETIFFTGYLFPVSNVLKRELLFIPLFGWLLGLTRQIAINRGTRKAAFRQLMTKGTELIKKGHYVLIFPEGTRTPPGQPTRFAKGGATLAAKANVPMVPVAVNSGEFWPKKGWAKYAGVIDVVFGEAIAPAKDTSVEAVLVVNKEAEQWVEETMKRITHVEK